MSAIFGLFHRHGAPVDAAHLERMSAALAAHGEGPGTLWRGGAAGLGHRLMRFTPQDDFERQPLASGDGRLVLVGDARVDNRDEIGAGLNLGPRLGEMPDSALILEAYETWGTDCLQCIRGSFAFAVWDTARRTLFAARSPIVAPYLVYTVTSDFFAFATMPCGLFALPFVTRALNEERLAGLLAQLGSDPPATLYRDVLHLPSGHWLSAGPGGVKARCYWRPDRNRETRFARDEDYREHFRELFTRAVRDQLRSRTPVAVQMSGGLDSSSVAAAAAILLAARGERLTAYTEVPPEDFAGPLPAKRYADETPFVRAVAQMHPNLDLELVRTDGRTFLEDLDRLFSHLELPFRNAPNRVWIEAILRQAGQAGTRVLLDGLQGNLTMSWGGQGLLPGLIRRGRWTQALGQARAEGPGHPAPAPWQTLFRAGLLPLLPDPAWRLWDWLRHPESRRRKPSPAIHPDFARAQKVASRVRSLSHAALGRLRADTRRYRYRALMLQDHGAYLSAYRAMYGVDMRTPTADVRLAEFCLSLPEEQYRRDGLGRRLVRMAMSGQLPPLVLNNRQSGLQAADWFERLRSAPTPVAKALAQMEHSRLARSAIDLSWTRRVFERLQSGEGKTPESEPEFALFQTALMVGSFLCWVEAENRKSEINNLDSERGI